MNVSIETSPAATYVQTAAPAGVLQPRCAALLREGGSAPKGGCSLYKIFFTSVKALLVKFPSAQWQRVV